MAKDYAARNKRARNKPAGIPGWIWLVAGLSLGLAVAAIVYITRPASPMPMAPGGQVAKQDAPRRDSIVNVPPKADARFDFYKLLKKEKVVVPSENVHTTSRQPIGALPSRQAAPASAAAVSRSDKRNESGSYWVFAGAYRQSSNADEQRARLAFLGIESRIEMTTSDDGSKIHRVTVGPEARRDKAEKIVSELKANGFSGLVVKR